MHSINGHSAVAYEATKDMLERKYGGRRRQIAIYLEELAEFKQIRLGNSSDLELNLKALRTCLKKWLPIPARKRFA